MKTPKNTTYDEILITNLDIASPIVTKAKPLPRVKARPKKTKVLDFYPKRWYNEAMKIYKLTDFDKCTREQLKYYLSRWGVPYNSKASTKALKRKAMRTFEENILAAANKAHKFLLWATLIPLASTYSRHMRQSLQPSSSYGLHPRIKIIKSKKSTWLLQLALV